MFLKIFFKEWRENILIFSLSIVLLFALVVLNFAGEEELTMYFSGMFLWIFLPFAALLIGSSGYYSEFKDNAWIYMFSRPVKKWQIWLTKYVALLSIFITVILIFYLLLQFLPELKDILDDSGLLFMMGGLISYSPFLLVSFLALTISYSISILSEKQFVLVFVSILIGTGFLFLTWKYQEFLIMTYFYFRRVEGLVILAGLSFMAASVLTFIKADFSQQGKKILRFSKNLVFFIIISFVIHLVWVTKGRLFSTSTVFHSFHSHKVGGDVYINSFQHGILKFDTKNDEFVKLNRKSRFSEWIFSVAGGKVAFLKDVQSGRQYYTNLLIMNMDGSEAQALTESHKKDSPFHEDLIRTSLLSPDGGRVAIISVRQERSRNTAALWWMEPDGKRLQKIDMPMPGIRRFRLIAWSEIDDCIYFTAEEKTKDVLPNVKLVKVDLETGDYRVLIENILNDLRISVSPGNKYLVIRYMEDLESRTNLTLLNLFTLEQKILHSDVNLRTGRISWNKEGDKIAFWRITNVNSAVDNKLRIYSVDDDEFLELDYGDYHGGLDYDWLANEDKLIVSDRINGIPRLRILDEHLEEERTFPLSEETKNHWTIWGLDNAVLVQRSRRGGFWRLDLETEEWKKVF
jgi:Tol biopolymer transport system component/ABC-type transport system involved in multi-copper enzyme maturation permease subunit